MKNLGDHKLVEFFHCCPKALCDLTGIENAMLGAARAANATIITHHFHHFSPLGVSGAVIIAESHFTIHTWPEYQYAAVDLFTCGELRTDLAFNFLKEFLKSDRVEEQNIVRGLIAHDHFENPLPNAHTLTKADVIGSDYPYTKEAPYRETLQENSASIN